VEGMSGDIRCASDSIFYCFESRFQEMVEKMMSGEVCEKVAVREILSDYGLRVD
jgi:hypothetical protein